MTQVAAITAQARTEAPHRRRQMAYGKPVAAASAPRSGTCSELPPSRLLSAQTALAASVIGQALPRLLDVSSVYGRAVPPPGRTLIWG